MKRFEYHILKLETGWFSGGRVDTSVMDKHINELGAAGWELVSALDTNKSHGETRDVLMIFKRERQS